MIYTGLGAGADNAQGSAADLLCLPSSPELVEGAFDFWQQANSNSAQLSLVEYQTGEHGAPSMRALDGYEVPCALCERAAANSTTLMVPGSLTCPTGYAIDYTGAIFAGSRGRGE